MATDLKRNLLVLWDIESAWPWGHGGGHHIPPSKILEKVCAKYQEPQDVLAKVLVVGCFNNYPESVARDLDTHPKIQKSQAPGKKGGSQPSAKFNDELFNIVVDNHQPGKLVLISGQYDCKDKLKALLQAEWKVHLLHCGTLTNEYTGLPLASTCEWVAFLQDIPADGGNTGPKHIPAGRSVKVQGFLPTHDVQQLRALLINLCEKFGHVESVKVPPVDVGKGENVSPHAFVNFATPEAALMAQQQLDGKIVQGAPLRLKLVRNPDQPVTCPSSPIPGAFPPWPAPDPSAGFRNAVDPTAALREALQSGLGITSDDATHLMVLPTNPGFLSGRRPGANSPLPLLHEHVPLHEPLGLHQRSDLEHLMAGLQLQQTNIIEVSGFPAHPAVDLVRDWLLRYFAGFCPQQIHLTMEVHPPRAFITFPQYTDASLIAKTYNMQPTQFFNGDVVALRVVARDTAYNPQQLSISAPLTVKPPIMYQKSIGSDAFGSPSGASSPGGMFGPFDLSVSSETLLQQVVAAGVGCACEEENYHDTSTSVSPFNSGCVTPRGTRWANNVAHHAMFAPADLASSQPPSILPPQSHSLSQVGMDALFSPSPELMFSQGSFTALHKPATKQMLQPAASEQQPNYLPPRAAVTLKVLGLPHGRSSAELEAWLNQLFTQQHQLSILSVRCFPTSQKPYALLNMGSLEEALQARKLLNHTWQSYGPTGENCRLIVFLKQGQTLVGLISAAETGNKSPIPWPASI